MIPLWTCHSRNGNHNIELAISMNDLKIIANDLAVDDNLIIRLQKMVPLNTSHCQTMHWNRQSE